MTKTGVGLDMETTAPEAQRHEAREAPDEGEEEAAASWAVRA